MADASRSASVAVHAIMAALFAVATAWAIREAWVGLQGAGFDWRVALRLLAALGFVSLTVRELRILAR